MITRIHVGDDEAIADQVAALIDQGGHEVAVVTERFVDEDDQEVVEFVVCTPAPVAEIDLSSIDIDEDFFIEID